MCSGCSGNYEADGEQEEMPRQTSGEKKRSDSVDRRVSGGAAAIGSSLRAAGAGPEPSVEEFDVFVSEDRIVEVRRIGRVSPGFRLSGRDEDGFELDKWEFFRHSGHESAKRYGKPERRSREELLRFDVLKNWRDFNE